MNTDISIITTLYYSENYLVEFLQRTVKTVSKITDKYEIILVNDGSPDHSLEIAFQFQRSNKKIKVIDLSRNYGHDRAIMTGFSHATGKKIFLIDCDLEEEPEWLGIFYHFMRRNNKCDVVYGVQDRRKGQWFERISGHFFYKIFNLLSDTPIAPNPVTSRLMTTRYVQSLLKYREREFFLAGLYAHVGYVQHGLPVHKRSKRKSTFSLRKKIALSVNAITSFSDRPLIIIFYAGILITLLSFFCIAFFILKKLFWGIGVSGWASTLVSIYFVGGLIIFFLGIIGIYLSRIFIEVKPRPYVTIRSISAWQGGRLIKLDAVNRMD